MVSVQEISWFGSFKKRASTLRSEWWRRYEHLFISDSAGSCHMPGRFRKLGRWCAAQLGPRQKPLNQSPARRTAKHLSIRIKCCSTCLGEVHWRPAQVFHSHPIIVQGLLLHAPPKNKTIQQKTDCEGRVLFSACLEYPAWQKRKSDRV